MEGTRWIRKRVTFNFANGAAGADLIQSESLVLEGEILHIHQRNSDNTGNRTAQLTLEDVDGFQMWDGTAKAENANYDHEFGVTIRRILSELNTLKCTISGDPGASGYTVEAIVYLIASRIYS
ncbi:MAG: hypothetical protein WC356_02245 [Candidatus Micrarchaeia archaeon]|jgi:hypothetical protein